MRESEGIDAERGRVYVTKREIESEREREREQNGGWPTRCNSLSRDQFESKND